MRKFSTFVMEKLLADDHESFSLIELELETISVYSTTLPYSVQVDWVAEGTRDYQSDVGILDYSTPIQTTVVDRQTFSLSLSDNLDAFKSAVGKSNSGRPARILLGFFDSDGQPNLDPDNLLVVYAGYIDGMSYSNDFEEATVTLELSSPMADLSLVSTLVTSADGMDQISSTDTSFDRVIEDNEEIIKWGKK